MNVYDLNREQFRAQLEVRVAPALVYQMASEIYTLLQAVFAQNCNDSVLREWTFQWASEKLDIDYDQIYDRWLS